VTLLVSNIGIMFELAMIVCMWAWTVNYLYGQ